MEQQPLRALMVNSSPRQENSLSRRFANKLIQALQERHGEISVQERDVSQGIPFVDDQWVNANFTAEDQRTAKDKTALSYSDSLVSELKQSDLIVLAVPLYNFSVPASLKAWIDQIARVGLTFNYTVSGPVGKLNDKKAYIVMVSGGTKIGSDIDFASNFLKHVLGFVGITDVTFIVAEAVTQDDEQKIRDVNSRIRELAKKAA